MKRDWNAIGITWEDETLTKDGVEIAGVQVMSVGGYDAFKTAVESNGGSILALLNSGTTLRQRCFTFKRNNPSMSGEAAREAIWRNVCGERSGARIITVTVLALPDGTMYNGTSRTEFIAAYMAAGVDVGMGADVARAVAERIANAQEHLA